MSLHRDGPFWCDQPEVLHPHLVGSDYAAAESRKEAERLRTLEDSDLQHLPLVAKSPHEVVLQAEDQDVEAQQGAPKVVQDRSKMASSLREPGQARDVPKSRPVPVPFYGRQQYLARRWPTIVSAGSARTSDRPRAGSTRGQG